MRGGCLGVGWGSEQMLWIRLVTCTLVAAVCVAWHDPHVTITRAAIQSLPEGLRGLLADDEENIAQLYSFYPDRYRNASLAEQTVMRRFCELPGGIQIHNVTWDKARDIKAVEYLFDGIIASLGDGQPGVAARYAGTLAHLLEDSLSPAHAVDLRLLQELVPPPEHARKLYVHAPMELSCPNFTLDGRNPRRLATTVPEAARAVIEACYAGIRKNRGNVIELLHAVYRGDMLVMDRLRLAAARSAAEQYADALYTVLVLAQESGIREAPRARREPRTAASPGLHVETIPAGESSRASRGAGLNLVFGLREAVRSLAIDQRVLRTELGRVHIGLVGDAERTCIEVMGDWPPHSGSQVTELCLDRGGIGSVSTKLDGVPDVYHEQRPFGQWIRTVDHRGDPLFELRVNVDVVSVRNHKGVIASIKPTGRLFDEGVLLTVDAAEPLSIRVSEREDLLYVDVPGRGREIVSPHTKPPGRGISK
jgi:hypothetical protein